MRAITVRFPCGLLLPVSARREELKEERLVVDDLVREFFRSAAIGWPA